MLQRGVEDVSAWDRSAFEPRHQTGVAARGGGVDAGHALGREARDVVGTAGLGSRPAQPLAAERLALDHRADLIAVDVKIADPGMFLDIVAHRVDPALQPESEAIAGCVDLIDDLAQAIPGKADDVKDRTKVLAFQLA